MDYILLVGFGIMTGYIWYLNRKLNHILRNQVVGTIILDSLKGVVKDASKEEN